MIRYPLIKTSVVLSFNLKVLIVYCRLFAFNTQLKRPVQYSTCLLQLLHTDFRIHLFHFLKQTIRSPFPTKYQQNYTTRGRHSNENMSSYFYVVNQSSGKVLDSHRNCHNAQLIAHEENRSSGQLWKWDSEARLVNKHGFVADILSGSKDTGTPIILNTPVDECLGQKWRVDEDTIKSGLSGLVMDASKSWVTMQEPSVSLSQKWEFVPEDCWEDYKMMLGDRNPLTEAAFWKNVVENYTDVIIGYNIEDYGNEVKQAIEVMNMYADKLEQVNKGTGVTHATGGLASVIGGGMAIGGLLLAPVTAGASLALTIGGTAVGIGGGAVTLTFSVVNNGYGQSKSKKVKMKQVQYLLPLCAWKISLTIASRS